MTPPVLLKFDGQPMQAAAAQLAEEIRVLIYEHAERRTLPLPLALGVLQIVAVGILEDQKP